MEDNPAAASAVTASFTLRTPPQYTFDNPAQWTAWLQQFEDYSFASGLSSAPEETKVRTLLYCMGPQGREVLSSLMSDAEAYRSYSGGTTSLSGYFVHPVNEVYESSRFHKRTQEVGESVDAFFTALRNLVKKCNYASREIDDRLVRDRFIVGLLDSRLTDQLCRNPKLTLDEALIQARQYEDAENEKRRRQGTDFAPDALNVDAVANKQYRMAAAPARETARSNVCRPPEYRAGPKSACDFCGHAPHPRSECPARWATCNHCRKNGHFAAVCRSNSTRRLSQIQLCAVDAAQTERRHVVVHVNGRPLQFKVDTGADVSVVPPSFPGCPVDLDKPNNEQLMGPGRCRLKLLGTFPATLSWRGRTRFRIRLMRYQFTVKYVPVNYLATADTLSRDPDCSSASKVDSTEIFVSMVVAALPSTLVVRLEDFRSHQTSDGECSMLKAYSMKGWPRRDQLPLNMTRYWEHRGDFTICEDLLFMGGRLVVPEALRRDIVNLLHDGHQGVNRCLAVARDSVWWPGLNSQVKAAVENCPACASTRVQRCEPMIPTETPSAPWERVAIDLFHFANQDFLVVVDYRSRYPEVITLRSTSADAVISAIKSTFARHGIPVTVVSDNGPQFSCEAFEDFARLNCSWDALCELVCQPRLKALFQIGHR
ncbi:uncharacterized protein LOC144148507 [Haemaphysalis longicornis]